MKKRSVALSYIFIWLSIGIYIFIWMFSTMKGINHYRKEKIFNIKRRVGLLILILTALMAVYSPYFLSALDLMFNQDRSGIAFLLMMMIGLILSVIWFIIIAKNLWDIASAIREIELEMNVEKPIDNLLATALFFVYFTAIIYIQKHVNLVVDKIEK
ncbi:hypothetical protein [Vallitalea okinawensis]|uniref:hypothetical protein n=1 Tax=Vallitalea okinawensis TaxID=2078660 RepID=UPI000CFC83F2|nr:hypothetical protein [Vallitalea okinawensis]